MAGSLYPAYQKLYSALTNLEKFGNESDFFDNISCLDGFFSEYRNITFMLQKALKGTKYYSCYEKNRERYLTDHWFVEKRNETTKEIPFQLVKEVLIAVYTPVMGFPIFSKQYSVESDTPISVLISEIKSQFGEINEKEVFFSAIFSFHEKGSNDELLNRLQSGISAMMSFMTAMEKDIGETCALCDELKSRIEHAKIVVAPIDFLQAIDYVYYPERDSFDRAERASMAFLPGSDKTISHMPLSELTNKSVFKADGTAFASFTLMHAFLRCINSETEIFPAIMVVYGDGTYDLDAFLSTLKTTTYRKINEVANQILNDNVIEVCYMCMYSNIPFSQEAMKMTSGERLEMSASDIMVCASIDDRLNEKEYVFDGKSMAKPDYVACVIKNGQSNSLNLSRNNLFPIWYAFKQKHEKPQLSEEVPS